MMREGARSVRTFGWPARYWALRSLDEVVTVRERPNRKEWETVGSPQLLVIGSYGMGVEIVPDALGSLVRVFIDFDLPSGTITHRLGRLFARRMRSGASIRCWREPPVTLVRADEWPLNGRGLRDSG